MTRGDDIELFCNIAIRFIHLSHPSLKTISQLLIAFKTLGNFKSSLHIFALSQTTMNFKVTRCRVCENT